MKLTQLARFAFSKHCRYLILGGGTGGISISAHLIRSGVHSSELTIMDPAPYHYYQPGWTMVGAGQWMIHPTERPMEKIVPQNVTLAKEKVKLIKPE